MGQDTSCGICGKHYQDCPHYMKEHIPTSGKALCGAKNVILLNDNWEDCDIDTDDICKKCLKIFGPIDDEDDIWINSMVALEDELGGFPGVVSPPPGRKKK